MSDDLECQSSVMLESVTPSEMMGDTELHHSTKANCKTSGRKRSSLISVEICNRNNFISYMGRSIRTGTGVSRKSLSGRDIVLA